MVVYYNMLYITFAPGSKPLLARVSIPTNSDKIYINSDKFRHSTHDPHGLSPPRLLLLLVPAPATFTATRYKPM